MVFEHIENLKRVYTDQLVVVDDNRPELGRFQGLTGTVKTVNMSGRALVEFNGNNNIGWYDIDVDFLKLMDEPVLETETVSTHVPPAEENAAPAAAEPEAPPAPEPKAEAPKTPAPKPAAAPANTEGMSIADMMAAAQAADGAKAEPEAAPAPAPAAAPIDKENMSIEEMLAASRAKDGGDAPAPAAEPEAAPAPAPAAAPIDKENMSIEEMLAASQAKDGGDAPAPAAEPAGDGGDGENAQELKDSGDVDGMIAYCRETDG